MMIRAKDVEGSDEEDEVGEEVLLVGIGVVVAPVG